MRIDQEMACDETVVTRFPDARRAYAQALVKAQLAIRPLPLGCYWPSGTEHPLLERIAMLKRNDLSRSRRLAGGAALAVLCAATGLAAWASQPPQMRIAPTPAIVALPAAPAVAASRADPAEAPARAATPATPIDAGPAEIAKLGRLALASAAPVPEVHAIPVVAADPPPAPGALASLPKVTDAQRETFRGYMDCQRAAVKALDDGHASEDVIAPQVEKRCEAQYQTYRQAWITSPGAGTPEDRAWNLDNSRLERSRSMVHASRRAQVMVTEVNSCIAAFADQLSSEPFDRVVDQAVERCGTLIPFPVPPIERASAPVTGGSAQELDAGHEKAIRGMVTFQLRRIAKAKAPRPE
jgi:hypothetical protein